MKNSRTRDFIKHNNKDYKSPAPRLGIVRCGEPFQLEIEHSIVVADCNNITTEEEQRIADGVYLKWRSRAESLCSDNGDTCPVAMFIDIDGNLSCAPGPDGKSVLTAVVAVTGKCGHGPFAPDAS